MFYGIDKQLCGATDHQRTDFGINRLQKDSVWMPAANWEMVVLPDIYQEALHHWSTPSVIDLPSRLSLQSLEVKPKPDVACDYRADTLVPQPDCNWLRHYLSGAVFAQTPPVGDNTPECYTRPNVSLKQSQCHRGKIWLDMKVVRVKGEITGSPCLYRALADLIAERIDKWNSN